MPLRILSCGLLWAVLLAGTGVSASENGSSPSVEINTRAVSVGLIPLNPGWMSSVGADGHGPSDQDLRLSAGVSLGFEKLLSNHFFLGIGAEYLYAFGKAPNYDDHNPSQLEGVGHTFRLTPTLGHSWQPAESISLGYRVGLGLAVLGRGSQGEDSAGFASVGLTGGVDLIGAYSLGSNTSIYLSPTARVDFTAEVGSASEDDYGGASVVQMVFPVEIGLAYIF